MAKKEITIFDKGDKILITDKGSFLLEKDMGHVIFCDVALSRESQERQIIELKEAINKVKKIMNTEYDSYRIKRILSDVDCSPRFLVEEDTLNPYTVAFLEYMCENTRRNTVEELEQIINEVFSTQVEGNFKDELTQFINDSKTSKLICCGAHTCNENTGVWCVFEDKLVYIDSRSNRIFSRSIKFGKYNIKVIKNDNMEG